MSSTTASDQPPVGYQFVGYDEFEDLWFTGEVLGCPGAGYLLCKIYGAVRMVPPEQSVGWQFFKTREACLAAREKRK